MIGSFCTQHLIFAVVVFNDLLNDYIIYVYCNLCTDRLLEVWSIMFDCVCSMVLVVNTDTSINPSKILSFQNTMFNYFACNNVI